MKSSPLIWQYVVGVKLTVNISLFFVAFLEKTDFIEYLYRRLRQKYDLSVPDDSKIHVCVKTSVTQIARTFCWLTIMDG